MHPRPDPVGPGQESVWDYPRPPALRRVSRRVEVWLGGLCVARTGEVLQVLETSHPPTYYLPRAAFAAGVLRDAPGSSHCEWKGQASYLDLVATADVDGHPARTAVPVVAAGAAWTYPTPTPTFAAITGHVAVMAARVDRCTVDGETVAPQPGGFYGGWITADLAGPFKGIPGSWGW